MTARRPRIGVTVGDPAGIGPEIARKAAADAALASVCEIVLYGPWEDTEISRFVRAADYAPFPSPWGHPRATLDGHEVGIAKVAQTGAAAAKPPGTIHELTDVGAVVATGDELLVVQRVEAGGRYVKPSELLRH